jgi:dipeptidyl aminopeptidase/acylaminoacyl peptidase
MRRTSFAVLTAALIGLLAYAALAQQSSARRKLTADDLYAMRFLGDAQISPDGRHIAFIATTIDKENNRYQRRLWLVGADGGEAQLFSGVDATLTQPRWSPDGRQLAFVSARGGNRGQIFVINTGGGEARQITNQKNGASAPVWSPDGARLAFTSRLGPADEEEKKKDRSDTRVVTRSRYKSEAEKFIENRQSHIFTVKVSEALAADSAAELEKLPKQLTSGEWDDSQASWSPDGRQIAFVSNRTEDRDDNNNSDIWLVAAEGGEARKLTTNPGPDGFPVWSPDGKWIAYSATTRRNDTAAQAKLWVIPAAGGEPVDLFKNFDLGFGGGVITDTSSFSSGGSGLVWTPDGRRLIFGSTDQGSAQLYSAAVDGSGVKPLTKGEHDILGFSLARDGRTTAIVKADAVTLPEVWTMPLDNFAAARPVTRFNAKLLDSLALSKPEEMRFKGADDWEMQGWLMKPVGFTVGKKYPLVLQVHGGPHAMYGWGLFHEFQLLAARGMGVLFINPRGSSGYGQKFQEADRMDWGGKDYEDLMKGVDAALARNSWIDADRLGVAGGSYGGFMTTWIIGHTDRFKAAVPMRGVYNLQSFYGSSDAQMLIEAEFNGFPWDNVELIRKHSPVTYAPRIKTPALIIHSEMDFRVPIAQAEELFITLKKLKREVEFVRFPREGHDLSRSGEPKHRIERLNRIVAWFEKYLKPEETAVTGSNQ